jgi:glycosyltransferase involved in cell wall biosynthesis
MAAVGAVVSTPYLYAKEVLADGRGLLVPFADSTAMAESTLRLLMDEKLLAQTRLNAYQYAKPMFWPNVGRLYLNFFGQVVAESRKDSPQTLLRSSPLSGRHHRGDLLHKGM